MIGIYDSGLGGLTVMQAVREILPSESLIYLADTKNFPYGNKTKEELLLLATNALRFLSTFPLKAVVIACNTLSASVIEPLRERFPELPIFEVITPLIHSLSHAKNIALLATPATIASKIYPTLLQKHLPQVELIECASSTLASLIEEAQDRTLHLKELLFPLIEKPIDTLILGCTHYPLIKEEIAALLPHLSLNLIDNAGATANALKQFLIKHSLLSNSTLPVSRFFASHLPSLFEQKGQMTFPQLLTTRVDIAHL